MTKVDFYILQQQHGEARARFACRLAEKAWQQGNKVYIHTESAEQSQRLDEMLWTFRAGSFVPHSLDEDASADASPIHIGHTGEPQHHDQVLINLAPEVPLFFSRFERVAELVDQSDECRTQGRERFRFYRDRGYPLDNHTINAGQG
jgi:DNA polymerase-3 subunit chi